MKETSNPVVGMLFGACFGIAIWYALWSLIGWKTLILAALIALAWGVGLWIGSKDADARLSERGSRNG